jgi:hypothetical protein
VTASATVSDGSLRPYRAGTGSEIELRRQMGWIDHRMSDRYVRVRPAEERLARPNPFGGLRGGRSQVAFPAMKSPMRISHRAVM